MRHEQEGVTHPLLVANVPCYYRRMRIAATLMLWLTLVQVADATAGKGGPPDWATVVGILVVSAGLAFAGRRLMNRLTGVLLGAAGGALAAGMWHNIDGALLGFAVGLVVAA